MAATPRHHPATPLAVGVDLGGTNLKVAIVDRNAQIIAQASAPTGASRGPGPVIDDMVRLARDLIDRNRLTWDAIAGVGVASPGPLDLGGGRIIKAANLPGWLDVPLRDLVARAVGKPAWLDNDANAAAFGEYRVRCRPSDRSGKSADPACPTSMQICGTQDPEDAGTSSLVLLTLGTGVGAGVILDGKILHGAMDNAAELGHMIVVVNGLACPCGQRGCLEQYASAAAVTRRAQEAIAAGESTTLLKTEEQFDAAAVATAERAGDALAARIWDEACLYLAVAIINIQHAFNPPLVLLGGGMSQAGDALLTRVCHHLDQQKWSLCADLPVVELAALGNDAGVIGAATLVWAADATL